MQHAFRKDLSHLRWDEVYARQQLRAPLVGAWMDALALQPGDRVLDVGAGPGFVSLLLGERVGPEGLVYALDRSADALAYLANLQKQRGISQIEGVVGDAALLKPGQLQANKALISMVLHHADDPAAVVRNVARRLPPGAPIVIAEFHPDGPCSGGPPREHRVTPEQVVRWCEEAGLTVLGIGRQTPEHYMLRAENRSGDL